MEDLLLHSDDYILKAKDYIDSWEYILAKRVLEELLEEHPDHSEGHHLLGKIYGEQLEKYNQAEKHLKLAIRFNRQNTSAYISYLDFLVRFDRADEVLSLIKELEGLLNRSMLLRYKAVANEQLQYLDDASAFYKEAILYSCCSSEISICEESLDRIMRKKDLKMNMNYFRESIII